jgi:hypothetical protein
VSESQAVLTTRYFGTQAAAERFIGQGGGGLVLNISSVHEDWPMPGIIVLTVKLIHDPTYPPRNRPTQPEHMCKSGPSGG